MSFLRKEQLKNCECKKISIVSFIVETKAKKNKKARPKSGKAKDDEIPLGKYISLIELCND